MLVIGVMELNNISSEYVVLEGENDIQYKYYEEKGSWLIEKRIGESNREIISSFPELQRVKILANHSLYVENEGEFNFAQMSEANKTAVLNITTVTQ